MKLRVLSPCTEDFDAMPQRNRARHCDKCKENVLDLSTHTEEEVRGIVQRGERPCVRMLRDRRTGQLVLAAAAAAAMAACSSAALDAPTPTHALVQPQAQPAPDAGNDFEYEMGKVVIDPEEETPERR